MAVAIPRLLYTALLTAITTTIVEGGDIASYSSKDIEALVEQSKDQIEEEGEKDLQSGEMPDDAHLEIMGLNDPTARGKMAIYEMGSLEDGAEWADNTTGIPESQPQGSCSFPTQEAQLRHIFRNRIGHIDDTPENRRKILGVAGNQSNYLGKDSRGNDWYAVILEDGRQMWVRTRNGVIDNAGINDVPRTWDPETGLYNNTKRE